MTAASISQKSYIPPHYTSIREPGEHSLGEDAHIVQVAHIAGERDVSLEPVSEPSEVLHGTVFDTLHDAVHPIVTNLDCLAEGPTSDPTPALVDAVSSGGQIVFDVLPRSIEPVLDALYVNGRYTDYNLALRTYEDVTDATTINDLNRTTSLTTSLVDQLLTGDDPDYKSIIRSDDVVVFEDRFVMITSRNAVRKACP